MTEPRAVLEVSGVRKYFGQVSALESVDLVAHAGEVHAIVGDNGAGKSTLIKILTGVHQRDAGEIRIQGVDQPARLSTAGVQGRGIAVVYQDLTLVESLDIASNMALGRLPTKFGFVLDRARMHREAATVLRDLRARVGEVTTPTGLLSGGQRQVVAVARAVRLDQPIVLLDEPTAALGVQESAHVGGIIDGLRNAGKAVVLVSHDLEFVFAHADRVTVMRLGVSVATRRLAETTKDEVIGMITGLLTPGTDADRSTTVGGR